MRLLILVLCLGLGGCAELAREVAEQAGVLGVPVETKNPRGLKPMPVRPLNVFSQCKATDEVGVKTRLALQVENAVVKQFEAEVRIPKRGTCRFDLRDFHQVATLPNVKLTRRSQPDCQVNMWEQGDQVTVGFSNCASSCEGDAFSYLWPILVESQTGHCI